MDSGSSDSSDDELSLPGNRDGTRSSAHAHELRIAATLAKDPWGRSVCHAMHACSLASWLASSVGGAHHSIVMLFQAGP